MRRFRKADKEKAPEASPDDTQEMFTAGHPLPGDFDETREYEAVTLASGDQAGELAGKQAGEQTETTGPEEAVGEEEPAGEFGDESFDEGGNEVWDDDEDEDWIDFEDDTGGEKAPEEDDESDSEGEAEGEANGDRDLLKGLKAWFIELRRRVAMLWSRLLKRIGDTKLPRHEIDGQKVLAGAGVAAVALLIASGGYLLGKGSGDDLDTARLEGEFAGRKAGAVAGATKGYAAGFKRGRDLAFERSYSASYRRNYRRAYENAGMDPPKAADIEVPEP